MSSEELLQNEDPATEDERDIRRWVALYRELLAFEEEMLDRIKEKMSSLSPAARNEAERSNVPALKDDCARFRDRLAFWERKLDVISAKSRS